ncbi:MULTISPECIES: ABC transporter permease [Streptomyces]|uniref:ABC transporter permease n=1 Tax=Streptomyces TaxID=1883 RepID=UPI0010716F6F|nr:ABC transporter permease [Streptomyces sp. 4R-3d]TFI25375.1 ABC transporter permease [Streptomyces sp. 4R-3d]
MTTAPVPTTVARRFSPRRFSPRRFSARGRLRPGLAIAWGVLALLVLAAVWPEALERRPPDHVDVVHALRSPDATYWFGTDQLGRDIYSRVVHGTRLTLLLGVGSVALALVLGTFVSSLAILGGRAVDSLVMRVTDVLLAFPGMLLALLVVAILGPGTGNALIAIGLSTAPGFARLVRGEALAVRESGFVQAAVVLGRPTGAVHRDHLLPNSLPPVLVLATVNIGTAIIAGSSLSFLGLGPEAPAAEWGAMLAEGRDFLDSAWALTVFPGLALTCCVITLNVVGADLRRRFDGRSRDGDR